MKRRLTRNVILMAIVTLIMGIGLSLYIASTGTVPAADNAASYTDGTYTASAHGCLSDVAVTVTITGGKVTNVDIDASGETPELGGKAAEMIEAEARNGKFLSWDDFKNRCKVSAGTVENMGDLGLLGDMPRENQMSLLDFMV